MKKYVTLLLAVAVLVLAVATSATASTTKLMVTPSQPVVGDNLVFSGCGYTPGSYVQVQAIHNTKTGEWILQVGETVGSNGCFTTNDVVYPAPDAGKWTATVNDYATGHRLASLIFYVS